MRIGPKNDVHYTGIPATMCRLHGGFVMRARLDYHFVHSREKCLSAIKAVRYKSKKRGSCFI